jgi:hypothetical protein
VSLFPVHFKENNDSIDKGIQFYTKQSIISRYDSKKNIVIPTIIDGHYIAIVIL